MALIKNVLIWLIVLFLSINGLVYGATSLPKEYCIRVPLLSRHPEFRSIKSLYWEDECDHDDIVGHFKAVCAMLGLPFPRLVISDRVFSDQVAEFTRKRPLNITSLKKLAKGKSPYEYWNHLLHSFGSKEDEAIDEFKKEFGIWQCATYWFRYPEQLKHIKEYVGNVHEDEPVRILVHATWNGEDAYSIAILLNYFYRKKSFEIFGKDIVCPEINELNWVSVDRLPKYLIPFYFDYKTPWVAALKEDFYSLVKLGEGDIRKIKSFEGGNLDIVVANNVLGQSVFEGKSIRYSLENIWSSLKDEGLFYMLNDSYGDERLRAHVSAIIMDMIGAGKFDKVGIGIYKKRTPDSHIEIVDLSNIGKLLSKISAALLDDEKNSSL